MNKYGNSRFARLGKGVGIALCAFLAGISVLACPSMVTAQAANQRPNILLILTDDHRYDFMSCVGKPDFLKTPNIDRIAHEGVIFQNAFATTALCSPSRASILTGCYAHKHGVYGNINVDPDPALPTFPKLLQAAGYETAFIGKWHMANSAGPRPGFDHWVSFTGQGKYLGCKLNVNGKIQVATQYLTDELTNRAVRYLRRQRTKPFLLYLSHKAVHEPWTPADRHLQEFVSDQVPVYDSVQEDVASKPAWVKAIIDACRQGQPVCPTPEDKLKDYLRTLLAVDEGIGRILKELERQQVLSNTVIIYASDNGYLFGEHTLGDKRSAYEPSMRIPLLMRYPSVVSAGTVVDSMVLNIDLAPTILELARVQVPTEMQGKSWLPCLQGTDIRKHFIYEYFQESRYPRTPTTIAIRGVRFKYVEYPLAEGEISEFYDIQHDPNEWFNLAMNPAYADKIDYLKKRLEWLKRETNFQMPKDLPLEVK
jgi:N-acetylglucosamine-6-sulfatase